MSLDLLIGKCNEGKVVVDRLLEDSKDMALQVQQWDRTLSDRRVALRLLEVVERMRSGFESLSGKLDFIQDQVLTLKAQEREKK